MKLITEVYTSFGFMPVETPAVENLDFLMNRGGGEENEKLIFKILKRGKKFQEGVAQGPVTESAVADFGLRFDLTLPLSRVVTEYRHELVFPWKVFHIGPVWRAERAQKGRFREFIQCDVDLIGSAGIGAELEVIQAVLEVLRRVGLTDCDLYLNDRRLLSALATRWNVPPAQLSRFVTLLDKKDSAGEFSVLVKSFEELLGTELPKELVQCLAGEWGWEDILQAGIPGGEDLKKILPSLQALDLPLRQIVLDPTLVRGMGYYTGLVFEIKHASAGYSFGGGGRYDGLIGNLSQQGLPACGLSIGFERLMLLLMERNWDPQQRHSVLFVPILDSDLRIHVLSYVSQLRKKGLKVDVYPEDHRLKKQLQFAVQSGYRWMLLIGQQEWESQVFQLKDLVSQTQESISKDDFENQWMRAF